MDLKYKFNAKEYATLNGISASSLRKRRLSGKLEGQYIKKGSDFFFIKGSFKNTENFNNTVSLSQDIKGNKKIQIDNKIIKKRKDLFGLNNVVVFTCGLFFIKFSLVFSTYIFK